MARPRYRHNKKGQNQHFALARIASQFLLNKRYIMNNKKQPFTLVRGFLRGEKPMTTKERAALKTQAMKIDSIFQIGKSSLTPAQTEAIKDALEARELIKISVLKNCMDDPRELAEIIAQRTGSQVVQVIGKKIVLYKLNPKKEEKRRQKAKLEKAKKKS